MLPGFGFTELLVIGAIALLVLKPEDIPALMRKLGVLSSTVRQNWHGLYQGWLEQAENQSRKGPKA